MKKIDHTGEEMAVDFTSFNSTTGEQVPSRTLSVTWDGWRNIRKVAEAYGWKPLGALKGSQSENYKFCYSPEGERVDYDSNDMQLVEDIDALNLARALALALAQLPDDSEAEESPPDLNAARSWRKVVISFIEFAELGGFVIQ